MQSIRIVVAGAGHLGKYHIQKIIADPDAELVGIVEPDDEKRRDMEALYNVPTAASVRGFVGQADAVIIATPTSSHLDVGLDAFDRGWHVLMEKPLARSSAEGEALVSKARMTGCMLQVGHTERFNPAVAAALAVTDRPGYIVAERLSPFSGRSIDVDVVLDLMIHDLDIVASLVNAPLSEVRAIGVSVLSHEIDMAAARLAFADGTVAQLSAGRASLEPSRKIRLFTRERYLSIDCQNREVKSVRRLEKEAGSPWPQITGEPIHVPAGDPLALQDHDFVDCIRNKRRPRVDGDAGLAALRLAEEVKRSLSVPAYPP